VLLFMHSRYTSRLAGLSNQAAPHEAAKTAQRTSASLPVPHAPHAWHAGRRARTASEACIRPVRNALPRRRGSHGVKRRERLHACRCRAPSALAQARMSKNYCMCMKAAHVLAHAPKRGLCAMRCCIDLSVLWLSRSVGTLSAGCVFARRCTRCSCVQKSCAPPA